MYFLVGKAWFFKIQFFFQITLQVKYWNLVNITLYVWLMNRKQMKKKGNKINYTNTGVKETFLQ